MNIHISNYKCHLNVTLFYVYLRFHLINTFATTIKVNAPVKDALTELPLLPLLPLPPFTMVFASSRFGPLHLSVEQQAIYKIMNNILPMANTVPTQVRDKFG